MMRKISKYFSLLIVAFILSGCLSVTSSRSLYPYEYSDMEKALLDVLGVRESTHVFSFNAPSETTRILVKVYTDVLEGGCRVIGIEERYLDVESVTSGLLVIQAGDDYVLNINVAAEQQLSFTTDAKKFEESFMTMETGAIGNKVAIEIGREIPVFYTTGAYIQGTQIISMQEYMENPDLLSADFLRMVTITFLSNK